jgi:hypothetical protein
MIKEFIGHLKGFVNNPVQWHAFCEFIDSEIETQESVLRTANDTIDIYRAQGAVKALTRLKYMKEAINGTR